MSDRLTLALDGSTRVCSSALLRAGEGPSSQGWELVASRAEVNGQGQAKVLLRLVDEMLEEVGAQPVDLKRVVVGIGPGTFTGVRIAVATARALALALNAPVFGVSSLAALAAGALGESAEVDRQAWRRVVPVIDARRQQLFFTVYESAARSGRHSGSSWMRSRPIEVCDRGALAGVLGAENLVTTVVTGEEALVEHGLPCGVRVLALDLRAEYLVVGQESLVESAEDGAKSRQHRGREHSTADGSPETVKPIYVRAPDADLHITKMKDPWAVRRGRR